MQDRIKITSYTDESGQDTEGALFIVSTVVIKDSNAANVYKTLEMAEKTSGKIRKWSKSGTRQKKAYAKLIIKNNLFDMVSVCYSSFTQCKKYTKLTGNHIAKAVHNYQNGNDVYRVDVKIDTLDNKSILVIKEILKDHAVRFYKVRAISEEKDVCIRLADFVCGIVRSVAKDKQVSIYNSLYNNLRKV